MKRLSLLATCLSALSAFACASQKSAENTEYPVIEVGSGNTRVETSFSEAAITGLSEAKGAGADDGRGTMDESATNDAIMHGRQSQSFAIVTASLPEVRREREAPYSTEQAEPVLTRAEQREREIDRGMTRQIRHAVARDRALSVEAKDVQIETSNGKVTLRGPVKTDRERDSIAAAARRLAGSKNVSNQIVVQP